VLSLSLLGYFLLDFHLTTHRKAAGLLVASWLCSASAKELDPNVQIFLTKSWAGHGPVLPLNNSASAYDGLNLVNNTVCMRFVCRSSEVR
jgi:hypothetical protein